MVTRVVREFGSLGILVNNAGIVDLAGIEETSLATGTVRSRLARPACSWE